MFAVVAAVSVSLAYFVKWKHDRQYARSWLHTHSIGGSIGYMPKDPSAFPWMLKFLGEEPEPLILIQHGPSSRYLKPVPEEYLNLLARLEDLFPEAVVIDTTPKRTRRQPTY
jgi:hypothetical protein